jgi:subtilisin family serine protease
MGENIFKKWSRQVSGDRPRCWNQIIFFLLLWAVLVAAGHGGAGNALAGSGAKMMPVNADDPVDPRGRPIYRPGELLVEFAAKTPEAEIRTLHGQSGGKVLGRARKGRLHRVRFSNSRAALVALKRYRNNPRVVHVERHALRYPQTSPNDPNLAYQWALARIAAPAGWNFATGSDDMVIAVIDSGIDYQHPDLAANIWVNGAERDGIADVDDDGNGYVDDVIGWDFAGALFKIEDPDADPMDGAASGHGTHVAGIIAAAGNNGEGIAGLCWNARIMPLKVKADDAEDYGTFEVIEAIDYAVRQNVRIVNCSFGGTTSSDLEYQAFARLHQAGGIAVCAAGNGGADLDQGNFVYPACYDLPHIIAVAAAALNDTLASFSNWGQASVDVMAPGKSILSTVPAGSSTEAAYDNNQGTSMATPHVAGLAGLIWSRNPTLTAAQVKEAILNGVDRIDAVSSKIASGGRINAQKALCIASKVRGDLNCDGQTSLADAVIAGQLLIGRNTFVCRPCLLAGTDPFGDDMVSPADMIVILQILAGWL